MTQMDTDERQKAKGKRQKAKPLDRGLHHATMTALVIG